MLEPLNTGPQRGGLRLGETRTRVVLIASDGVTREEAAAGWPGCWLWLEANSGAREHELWRCARWRGELGQQALDGAEGGGARE